MQFRHKTGRIICAVWLASQDALLGFLYMWDFPARPQNAPFKPACIPAVMKRADAVDARSGHGGRRTHRLHLPRRGPARGRGAGRTHHTGVVAGAAPYPGDADGAPRSPHADDRRKGELAVTEFVFFQHQPGRRQGRQGRQVEPRRGGHLVGLQDCGRAGARLPPPRQSGRRRTGWLLRCRPRRHIPWSMRCTG